MSKKNKAEKTDSKVKIKRWGIGKTLAVVISSVAFVVGAAILGVYLARGFDEETSYPSEISFDVQSNQNYNSLLNRLEITTQEIDSENSFELTITSSTSNITARTVTLDSVSTYAYNTNSGQFGRDFLGVSYEGGYVDNGILRFPRQVTIGQPFTVYLSTYRCNDTPDGSYIDQIRGGITTISATSENSELTPEQLTIAVDTPVYATETFVVDQDGDQFPQTNGVFEVTEEEYFYVETKFYPAQSRYLFSTQSDASATGALTEKTTFYQIDNENITEIYDSATSKHFYAENITEGVHITWFTAKNARLQQEIEDAVGQLNGLESDEDLYQAYIIHYSAAASDQTTGEHVLSDNIELNVVQASVETFEVGSEGQTFNLHDQAPLRIYVGDYSEQARDRFLSAVITSRNGPLNNILQNVVVSFSYNGQDPTADDAYLTVSGDDANPITIDGVNYYKATFGNPENFGTGYWDLQLLPGYVGRNITMTVSLLLENENGDYVLFADNNGAVQPTITLQTIEHQEEAVSWTDSSNRNITLTYAPNSSEPTPARVSLEGLTEIPGENIYQTPKYFVSFEGLDLEQAVAKAAQMFDGQIEEEFAANYSTNYGSLILVPLTITNDVLIISDVGQFNLYFATTNGFDDNNLYQIVQIVESPIRFDVSKTLYRNSVTNSSILYQAAGGEEFEAISGAVYFPTASDNTVKDQLQIQFTIAADSVEVFREEFNNGHISLKLLSGESDITSYFIQNASSLAAETNQDGTLTLTYTLQADNLSSVSQGDMAITQARLDFTDLENSSNNLSWTFENLFSDGGSLALYTPQAQTVDLSMDNISNAYTVSQTLSTEGQIVVEINNGDIDLSTLISNIAGAITTTDQHGRDDTLANSWYFTSNNPALQITTGADGISRHGFSFSGEGSAVLGISCGAVPAENTISFEISATGITGISYDTNLDPTANDLTGQGSIEEEISVEKYGAAGAALTLDNLIKFYVGGGTEDENEYNNNITFRLSPTYFTGKDEATLEQLFGQNGMLWLNGQPQTDLSQTALQNISIDRISINHNFAADHSITLLATDQSGAVRYSFVLNIRNNIANLSAPTSVDNIDANVATEIETAISYHAKVVEGYPTGLLSQGYIVPNEAGDGYVVENEERADAVGEIDANGNITFYHIFNNASQTFSVTFRPEVDNVFAVSSIINFTVRRNISVQNKDSSQVSAFETGTQNFENFFTVGQTAGNSGGFNYSFELPENDNNYIVVSGNGFTIAQNIRFDYGQTSLTQTVIVYVFGANSLEEAGENYYSQEVEIQISLPENFWSDVASSLTEASTSHQVFNNVNNTQMHYMVVVPGEIYSVGSYVSDDETTYSITPQQRDSQNGNNLSLIYNVFNAAGTYQLTYNSQNAIGDLLYGYGNQNVYTLLRFTSGEKTIDVAVPTIVSQIGTTFVSYAGQEPESSLENAMKSAEQLYEEGICTEIDAGKITDLDIAGDNLNGIFRPENITFSLSEGAAVGQALPSSLFKNFDVASGELSLNHLSVAYEEAYLALTYTLRNSSGATRTFNYLLKVNADVTVSRPNYPYSANGSAEYITITSSQQPVNLDEEFDETTAQDGHTRFEILQNGDDIGDTLTHQDSIVSVQVASSDHAFTDPAQWQGYINAYITNLNGNSTLVLGYPQTSDRIEIVVRRSYNGGEDINARSVVGGTIDYHFVLNDDREYTVRAQHDGITENGLTNYTWVLNDWTDGGQTSQTDPREETRSFFLIEGWQQGDDAHLGSTRPGLLFFNLHKPEGEEWSVSGNSNSFTATYNNDLTFNFEYDNMSGEFAVTYPTYLSREFNFSSTFFTERGELATINFAFKADAQAEIENSSFRGGQTVVWGDIFTITENGGTGVVSGYTVRIDSFKNGDINYSAFVRAGDSGLQLASVVQNLTGDLTLTVSWGTNKSYTFTIEDFTVQANLTQQDSATINGQFDTVIGGETISIAASNLLKELLPDGRAENSTISLSATAEQSAIESIEDGETLSIKFNQVGTQTTITLPITITVEPNFSGTSTQTEQVSTQIVVNVTFVIHPSVRIAAVYPSPDGEEMLDREYIESGTTFADFEDDFLSHAAVFEDGARIKVEYASNADDNISYSATGSTSIAKRIIISSITNATVTKGENEELKVDSEIDLDNSITFTRGSSGGQSLVDLSISYNNYVITYTIEIRDSSLFTLSVNSASNNISADSSSPYENVYVDKTDSTNLFAENRMAKAALSNNAAAGDYYIFFETMGSTVYQSKVINLSQNFVSQNQGGSTIYLDLGSNELDSLTELVDNLATDLTVGQYKAYMFADSYYQNALDSFTDQTPTAKEILDYLKENNSNQNVFGSTFASFELSSRITLTYAGYDVSYDEYSSMIKYFTSPEDITEKGLSDFSINNDTPLGTAVIGVDRFKFTYSNGGTIGETQTGIEKPFALQYRYMPDLDIQVGTSGEGSSVVIEVENPVRIVDAFDITRKSTGQAITMDEMVSGQADFTLVENGNSNQTEGGQRYIGISPVQYSGTDTVYDIELTGNGAPNEGKDVIFTLTYTVGGFKREFTVTVKVMPDYQFKVNGRVVDLGESLRFSNQDSPYVFEPNGTRALVLAGEDYPLSTTDGGQTTIEPYLSVVHSNSADGVELSVKNFNYTMTVDEMGSYNIKGNITAKLNMNDNGWGSTEDPPTYYKWNKNDDSLVFKGVKAVEFGEQYYHLVAKDDYGYQFDLYFTLSSGNTENPSISTESGALSLTEGEEVAFGAIYEELTVQLEDGGSGEQGGNLVITSQPGKPSSNDGTQVILIQNMEAWGFDQDYYGTTVNANDQKYFGGSIKKVGTDPITAYGMENNVVGQSDGITFFLNSTESQKYLKVPNFVDVTIDSIAYYYQDQEVGTANYSSSNRKIASSDTRLTNARSTDSEDYYYNVSETKLTLPTIESDKTWIYGTGNSVQVTMVVTLKYTPASDTNNTEYYQMQQQITLSKTSQITAERQYAADNTEITLAEYISVKDGVTIPPVSQNPSGYTIHDDTLAVAVERQSTTRFDLTYTPTDINKEKPQTVTLSAGNAATTYKSLYYSSLSGAFNRVLTGGTITITPHDDNATFYYGNNGNGGNKEVSSTNKTSFTKVADVNYFRVETFDGSAWSNYTTLAGYNYDSVNGGYDISLTAENETITISAADLVGSHENFRISYNGVYYYPQLEFDIAPITTDFITVASHYQLSSGQSQTNQYYVISWGEGDSEKAYRYTHQFRVTGTFASIESPTSIYTLPLGASTPISISTWAAGVTYTKVEKGDLKEDNPLANYSGDNLYFNITSDGTSGGTGLASIDAGTGAITLKEGFTDSHYVTVQIYQKVSGIDGGWGGTELSQMQLLETIRVYPASSTQTSGGNVTLKEILPEGTYYSNASKTISIPTQTSAELVVKNGEVELNRISLENESEQASSQSFTIAALLGYKAVQNYSSLKVCVIDSDGAFVSGFTLGEKPIEDGGLELLLGNPIDTDTIAFDPDENFAAETYLIYANSMLSIRTVSYQKTS